MKGDSKTDRKLKQFYSSSQTYLERLEKHDEKYFASYIGLCKKLTPPSSSILECGCGIGFSSYLLSKLGFKVMGVDISPLFISEAKRRYASQPNLKFLIEDVSNMSFSDQSFDAVCSFDLLEHVMDVKGTLKEMHRIVKNEGLLIIFMPNHLDPVQHLITCIRWEAKGKYKPWEAKTRIGAFYQFIKTAFLAIGKAAGINKKIYYLKPILSNEKNVCGEDFDATWLTNWFDIKNILKELGFSIQCIFTQKSEGRIMRIMRVLKLPKVLQSFYTEMRASGCVIVGRKK